MFTGFKIVALNAAKGVSGAVVLGVGFTLGAAITRAALESLSSAANKLANERTTKKVERKVANAAESVSTAA